MSDSAAFTTPIHSWLQSQSSIETRDGLVLGFGDFAREYSAATTTLAIADLSHRSRLEITGEDRRKLINNLCTNDVAKLAPGAGCEAFFLNAKGKTIDFAFLQASDHALWIDLDPNRADAMRTHLDRFIFREDVQIHDRSTSHALFHLIGPKADEWSPDAHPTPTTAQAISLAGCYVFLFPRQRSVFPGFDVICPAEHALAVWEHLLDQSSAEIVPVGESVMEALRIEAGLPKSAAELTEDRLPQELARDHQAISFTKGCYIGQETVARLDALGHVNKILRVLKCDLGSKADVGHEIIEREHAVGQVSSAADAPRWNARLLLAIVRVSTQPGTEVAIQTEAGTVLATVHAAPFRAHGE